MTAQTDRALDLTVSRIDLLLLAPAMTEAETISGCRLAEQANMGGVLVKPCFVHQAVDVLKNTPTRVTTVVGYPHGSNATAVKLQEAKRALTEGAQALEVSLNLGYLKAGQANLLIDDIRAVSGLAHMNDALVGVILDAELLTEAEMKTAAQLAVEAGADSVKINAASSQQPFATYVKWVREVLPDEIAVKLMVEELTLAQRRSVLESGCDRVGLTKLPTMSDLV